MASDEWMDDEEELEEVRLIPVDESEDEYIPGERPRRSPDMIHKRHRARLPNRVVTRKRHS